MWHWLSRRPGNSPPESDNVHASPSVGVDDDYLAEEVVLRALASARDGNPEADLIERFSAATASLELPPHIRIFRLRLPTGFMIAHPLLGARHIAMKYALRNPPKIETIGTQISIAKRCQKLLNDIELGREMPAQAGRVARNFAEKCNWNAKQLRNAVVMGVVVATDSQQKIEVRTPSKVQSVTATSIGAFFVIFAAFFAMYGIGRAVSCAALDCVLIGSAQLATIGLVLGIPPLQYHRTRGNLYRVASRYIT